MMTYPPSIPHIVAEMTRQQTAAATHARMLKYVNLGCGTLSALSTILYAVRENPAWWVSAAFTCLSFWMASRERGREETASARAEALQRLADHLTLELLWQRAGTFHRAIGMLLDPIQTETDLIGDA